MNPSPYVGRLEQLEKRIRYCSRRMRVLSRSALGSRRHRRACKAYYASVHRLSNYLRWRTYGITREWTAPGN